MAEIADYLAFYWEKVDAWCEEDERVFGHPHDPYHRIDIRGSGREVRVVVGGEEVARSRRALFLFETGLPTRYYIPREDVRMDLLAPSERRTVCAYKGEARYWSARVGGRAYDDVAWCYPDPLPEAERIRGHIAFYNERADAITLEGEPAPGTRFPGV